VLAKVEKKRKEALTRRLIMAHLVFTLALCCIAFSLVCGMYAGNPPTKAVEL
jgi:hypothetical protein